MASLKTLARNEEEQPRFRSGHSMCAGCGMGAAARTVLNSIPGPVVVVGTSGCFEVTATRFPFTAWGVPWIHVAFENAAALASGLEASYLALKHRGRIPDEPVTFVVFAGDGGTYDIGLQSLSGALERGHHFLYVCLDNEAYMNTGVQRSGATPFAANTQTSPVGSRGRGKQEQRKDITGIVVAHRVPYVGQCSTSHLHDLSSKVERAVAVDGPSFLNVLTSCPTGWGHTTGDSVRVARLAVETRFWPLYEVVEGHWRLTHEPAHPAPLQEWLELQKRFSHLHGSRNVDLVKEFQRQIDEEWQELKRRTAADAAWFAERAGVTA